MNYIIDLVGKRFGKLVVIERMPNNKHQVCMWKCRCDCGNERVIVSQSLRNGNTKSCGCLIQDNARAKPEHLHRRDEVPIKCGVYKIVNPLGAVYIGHSRNIYYRWIRHREANRKLKLHQSLRDHGWKTHLFEIEHELPFDTPDEILIQYEQVYIDIYKGLGISMLNVKEAGSGGKFSDESKQKMSKVRRRHFKFMLNGEPIEIHGLSAYCDEHGLGKHQMSQLYNGRGHYGNKNYYRGYSRVN